MTVFDGVDSLLCIRHQMEGKAQRRTHTLTDTYKYKISRNTPTLSFSSLQIFDFSSIARRRTVFIRQWQITNIVKQNRWKNNNKNEYS